MADKPNPVVEFLVQLALDLFLFSISAVERVRGQTLSQPNDSIRIVLCGRFYSDNWIKTHLIPLGKSEAVISIHMVSTTPVPAIDKVHGCIPPRFMSLLFGQTLSRLVLFFYIAQRERANYVGGFHLLPNALIALFVSKVRRIPAIYICGGGVREYEGGGFNTENAIFRRLNAHSTSVESRLKSAITKFDHILTMGNSVKTEIERLRLFGGVTVLPGGFDDKLFSPNSTFRDYDLVLVGRLSSVKNIEFFLDICAGLVKKARLDSAVIIGDGPSGSMLRAYATKLNLDSVVEFAGWQDNIETWLNRSKVFVLTSISEGLSQAMIQAMLCECPAVVPDIGDLRDVVHDGINGYLISNHSKYDFIEKLAQLLDSHTSRSQMGRNARRDAQLYSNDNSAKLWNNIFSQHSKPIR